MKNVQSNLAKGRVADRRRLVSIVAANALFHRARWISARGEGVQAVIQSYVTTACTCPLRSAPTVGESAPNGISIGSAVLARVPNT